MQIRQRETTCDRSDEEDENETAANSPENGAESMENLDDGESTETYEDTEETGSALMNVACTLCNKMFTYADDIQQHFLTEHSGMKEEKDEYNHVVTSHQVLGDIRTHSSAWRSGVGPLQQSDLSDPVKGTGNRKVKVKASFTGRGTSTNYVSIKKRPVAKRSKRLSSKERIDYGDHSLRAMGTEGVAAKRQCPVPKKRKGEPKKNESKCPVTLTPKIEKIEVIEQIPDDHLKSKGSYKDFRCAECDAVFSTRWALDKHKYDDHEQSRPFRCGECPRSFLKKHHLKEHEATHARKEMLKSIPSHPEADGFYHCRYCDGKYEGAADLKVHQEAEHKDIGAFPCKQCGKVLSAISSLRRHKMLVHDVGSKMFSCTECDASFTKKWALDKHSFDDHGRPRPFQCPECQRAFFRKQHLTEHQITHVRKDMMLKNSTEQPSEDGLFHCRFCAETFGDPVSYREHELIHTGFGAFPCSICSKVMHTERAKRRHERLTHNIDGKVFKCQKCEAEFTTEWMLTKHLCDDHGRPRPYQCPECPRGFLKKGHLHEHIVTHVRKDLGAVPPALVDDRDSQKEQVSKQDGEHQCRFCSERFGSVDECREHEFVHSGLGRFPCRICGKVLMTEKAMKRHERESHLQNVNCPECDLELASSFWLGKHLTESHGHPHPYWCSQCGQGFFRKRILLKHEKIHADATALHQKCPECETVLPSEYLLKKHLCDDHGHERPFHCVHCGRGFIKRGHLIDHENRHVLQNTGQHPLMCSQCGKGFVKAARLKEHEKLHHGIITDFKCPICNKDFFNVMLMKAHVTEVHGFDFDKGQTNLKGRERTESEKSDSQLKADRNQTDDVTSAVIYSNVERRDLKDNDDQSETLHANGRSANENRESGADENEDIDSIVVREWILEAQKEVVTCKECGHNCKTRKNFRDHMIRRHGEKSHFCSFCGKGFYQKSLMLAHERRHTGVRPFSCPGCQETFFDRKSLRLHGKKGCTESSIETVYECWECGETFGSNAHLKQHARSHLPFRCQGCDAPYKTKRSLREHCKIKHKAKLSEIGYYRVNVPKTEPEIKIETNNVSEGESNSSCEQNSKQDWTVQNSDESAIKIVLFKNKTEEQKSSKFIHTDNDEVRSAVTDAGRVSQAKNPGPNDTGPMNAESISKFKDIFQNLTKCHSERKAQSKEQKDSASALKCDIESSATKKYKTSILERAEEHLATYEINSSQEKTQKNSNENVTNLHDSRNYVNLCKVENEPSTTRAGEQMYQCNHCAFQTTDLRSVQSHLAAEHRTYGQDYTEISTHYNDDGQAVMRVNSTPRKAGETSTAEMTSQEKGTWYFSPEEVSDRTCSQDLQTSQISPQEASVKVSKEGPVSQRLPSQVSPTNFPSPQTSPKELTSQQVASHGTSASSSLSPVVTSANLSSFPSEISSLFPLSFPGNQHQAMFDRRFVGPFHPSSYQPVVSNERYNFPPVYHQQPTYLSQFSSQLTENFASSHVGNIANYYKAMAKPERSVRKIDGDSDSDSEVGNMLGFSALS